MKRDITRLTALILVVVICLQLFPVPALALAENGMAPSSERVATELEDLTTAIAKKEHELIVLNTQFRMHGTRVTRGKPWRIFAYNLGASAVSEAGAVEICASRWRYWKEPKRMSRGVGAAGPMCLMIGHCVPLGGVLTESAFDLLNDRRLKAQGLDLKSTFKKVLQLKVEIDELISKRDAILNDNADLSQEEVEIATAEGTVLKDVRNLALAEFAQFFIRAKRFYGIRDMNSLMGFISATTGGFGGSMIGMISAHKRQPRLVGPAGIGFMISGSAIVLTPLVVRAVADVKSHLARKKMISELGASVMARLPEQLQGDIARLSQMVARTSPEMRKTLADIDKRLPAYEKESDLFTAQTEMNAREWSLVNKELLERLFYATVIGGCKISWGANLANAGFSFNPRSRLDISRDDKRGTVLKLISDSRPSELFTRRVGVGAITYTPGISTWMFDTCQSRVRGIIRDKALVAQKKGSQDLLNERLDRVQEIDDMFNY